MWIRTRSDSEKRQAGTIMLWSGVPGVILVVTLFIIGLPSHWWSPKGARDFMSATICALLFAASGIFLLGAAVFIEDSEVKSHRKSFRSDQPAINPISAFLPLYSLAGCIACLVFIGRYLYLLFLFVPPPMAPLSDKLLTLDTHSKCVAFSPDGKTVVSEKSETLSLWEIETGALKQTLRLGRESTLSVAFSADGRRLAVASASKVMLWNLPTGQLERTISFSGHIQDVWSVHSGDVESVAFSPDAKTIASASKDGSVKVWDFNSGELKRTITSDGGYVNSVVFSPDSKNLVSSHGDKSLKLWDADNGTLIREFKGDGYRPGCVVFSAAGKTLVCFTGDSTEIWDVGSGTLKRQSIKAFMRLVMNCTISHTGKTLVLRYDDQEGAQEVEIVDVQTGKVKRVIQSEFIIDKIVFSPDDKRLAIGLFDNGKIEIWRLE